MSAASKVIVDTSGLWCLEPWLKKDFGVKPRSCRWDEYLALLLDDLCNPSCEAFLILPDARRLELGLPEPSIYRALLRKGLVSETDLALTPDERLCDADNVGDLFTEFELHAMDAGGALGLRAWFSLHNHPDVRDGWIQGIPRPHKDYPGVAREVVDALRESDSAVLVRLARIADELGLSRQQAMQLFSLIQRGRPYFLKAQVFGGRYVTHQIRWQALPMDPSGDPERRPGLVGIAAAGSLVVAMRSEWVPKDGSAIADSILAVRNRHGAIQVLLGENRREEAIEEIQGAIAEVVGVDPSQPGLKAVQKFLVSILPPTGALAGGVVDGVAGAGVGGAIGAGAAATARYVLPLVMPRLRFSGDETKWLLKARATRNWLDLARPLELGYETCARCGVEKRFRECSVCQRRRDKR